MNNLIDVKGLRPFKRFIMSIGEIPSAYSDSMSYYELLDWFCDYLQNQVIPTINNNANAVTELQNLYIELKSYVDNYFNNLDVQEEINNKLDDMTERGQLQEIITEYLNSRAVFGFNNVQEMKNATNLINGSYAQTLGFYSKGDCGGALYKVRELTNQDTINEMDIILLHDNLVCELICNTINVRQFGCFGDNTHDDTLKLQRCIDYSISHNYMKIYIPNGTYLISDTLVLPASFHHMNIEGENCKTSILKCNTTNQIAMIEYNGGSGQPSKNYIKNISFIGIEDNNTHNHLNIGIHVKGKDDFLIDNCTFTNFNVCILLENSRDRFTEYVIAQKCMFSAYKNCMKLIRTGTQWSFHGCGIKECLVQENAYCEEVLYIDKGCQLYNGYLDFAIWISSSLKDSLVYLNGDTSYLVQTRQLFVIGNIRYEGNIKKCLFGGVNIDFINFCGAIYGIGNTNLSLAYDTNFRIVNNTLMSGVMSDGSPLSKPTQKLLKAKDKTGSIDFYVFPETYCFYHVVVRLSSANVTLVDEMDIYRLNNPQQFGIRNQARIQNFNSAGIHTENVTYSLDNTGFHINLGDDSERVWNATIVLTPTFYYNVEEYILN